MDRTQPHSRCSVSRSDFFRLEPRPASWVHTDQFYFPDSVRLALPRPPNLESKYQRMQFSCQEENAKCRRTIHSAPISSGGFSDSERLAGAEIFLFSTGHPVSGTPCPEKICVSAQAQPRQFSRSRPARCRKKSGTLARSGGRACWVANFSRPLVSEKAFSLRSSWQKNRPLALDPVPLFPSLRHAGAAHGLARSAGRRPWHETRDGRP